MDKIPEQAIAEFAKAIELLEEVLNQVKSEEWIDPFAKRFIMGGIRISIHRLRHAKITYELLQAIPPFKDVKEKGEL